MKKILHLFLGFLFLNFSAQNVVFEDANLKTILLSNTNSTFCIAYDNNNNRIKIDANSDGEIQITEAEKVYSLHVWSGGNSSPQIKSIVGIKSFVNLKTLLLSSYGFSDNVTSFDLSNLSNLERLQIYDHRNATSLELSGCVKLKELVCRTGIFTTINMPNSNLLEKIDCSENNIQSLDLSNLPNLKQVICNKNVLTSLNLQGSTNLQELNCSNNKLTTLNLSGFSALKKLYCSVNSINALDLTTCTNLNYLECHTNEIPKLNLQGNTNITFISCENNKLTTLNVKDCSNLEKLNCNGQNVVDGISTAEMNLDISGCVKLKTLYANLAGLSQLNAENCTSLEIIECYHNNIASLNLTNCNSLININFTDNKLTSLALENFPNILNAVFDQNLLQSITAKNLPNIANLQINKNKLTEITLSNLPLLEVLDLSENELTTFAFPSGLNLKYITVSSNKLTSIDVSNLKLLERYTDSGENLYETINFEKNTALNYLTISSETLKNLLMKNGSVENWEYGFIPNLKFVCCDEEQLSSALQYVTEGLGLTGCSVSTYCSFVPGGNYNAISGKVRFDDNENGCDTSDPYFKQMRIVINGSTASGSTFVQSDGSYNFHVGSGNFTVSAVPENPSIFQVSPQNFQVNFANANNNTFEKDFCVSRAGGNQNDLEVIVAPVTNARPGFDAKYKVTWRNKGNTTLSGNVVFTFDNAKMSFISSELQSALSGNQLTFNFSNLKPFENTSSEVVFNINPPTNLSNPVNIGDFLNFSAQINPINGDILPNDNSFSYRQTVVGAFDPNDITCLEGSELPTAMIGEYLHYIINFENTGNYEAENVVVELQINPDDYDTTTLQLQNATFPVYTKIVGNKVEFIMKGAMLQSKAHGNVLFKIKSKSTLVSGDNVSNKANIYFDYNFPVETNDAITNFVSTLQSESFKKNNLKVFPVPTKDFVNISSDSKLISVEIYDFIGRILQKTFIDSGNNTIDFRKYSKGTYYIKVKTEKGAFVKKII